MHAKTRDLLAAVVIIGIGTAVSIGSVWLITALMVWASS